MALVDSPTVISEAELALRRDLAACVRLFAAWGWDDLVANHVTARLPAPDEGFLMNPFGVAFEEMRASDFIRMGLDGELLTPSEHMVNRTGFVIHGAVYEARPEIECVVHLHTTDGVAVSMVEPGLLPLNQTAMLIAGDIGRHEYEGIAEDLDERQRLVADLGAKHFLLMRNHGTLAIGTSVAAAFVRTYFMEWSCTVQNRAMATGAPVHWPSEAVIRQVDGSFAAEAFHEFATNVVWPAMLRRAARIAPDYAD